MHVKLLANTLPWRNGMGPLVSVFDCENHCLNGKRNEKTGIDIGAHGPIGNRLTDDFFGVVDISYLPFSDAPDGHEKQKIICFNWFPSTESVISMFHYSNISCWGGDPGFIRS